MPKRRPPYLVRERTRHGKIIWYVRIGHGPRLRIEGTYGTQEFVDNYTLALKHAQNGSSKIIKRTKLTEGSFDWLLHQYLQSMQWHNQSESTKKVKYRILNNVSKHIGIDVLLYTAYVVVMPFALAGKMLKIILFISKQKRANLKQMFFYLFYQNLQKLLKLVL